MLYVLSGHPTNYGLLEKLQKKWKKEAAMENLGIHLSTYNLSYNRHPRASFTLQHHAPSKSLSCHFHPHHVNKDLHLRGKQLNTAPEFPPTLAIPHNVPPDFPQSTILAVWGLCSLRTAYNKHASTHPVFKNSVLTASFCSSPSSCKVFEAKVNVQCDICS